MAVIKEGYELLPGNFHRPKKGHTLRPKRLIAVVGSILALFVLYKWTFSIEEVASIRSFHEEVEQGLIEDVPQAIQKHAQRGARLYQQHLDRQSKSVDRAIAHFQSTHEGRNPSKLYEEWVSFALKHDSPIVEDYGQVEASFKPFRALPSSVIQQRIEEYSKFNISYEGQIVVKNGTITIEGFASQKSANILLSTLAPLNHTTGLPDLRMPLNWWAEPRTMIGDILPAWQPNPLDHKMSVPENNIQDLRNDCGASDNLNEFTKSLDRPSVDICTSTNTTEGQASLNSSHAYFARKLITIKPALPIASWTRLSTQADIMVPNFCYGGEYYRAWNDSIPQKPYEQREDSLYWRGTPTGDPSFSQWRSGHRQRFVKRIQDYAKAQTGQGQQLEKTQLSSNAELDALGWKSLESLPQGFFNVSFTKLLYCKGNSVACSEMKEVFPLAKPSPPASAFDHKFLFDLDGNGMSCRFYRFLETESLVFKQTIFNEWHDDRVIPWVHYVPVSLDMHELPYLLDYFTNHQEGQLLAAKIARNGVDLASKALRKMDLTIHWYRVLTELAELLYM